jgi:hypothetical protein
VDAIVLVIILSLLSAVGFSEEAIDLCDLDPETAQMICVEYGWQEECKDLEPNEAWACDTDTAEVCREILGECGVED